MRLMPVINRGKMALLHLEHLAILNIHTLVSWTSGQFSNIVYVFK